MNGPAGDDPGNLSEHVTVRFPADMVDAAKVLAGSEGLTVSAWIRREVEREAARREQPAPELAGLREALRQLAADWREGSKYRITDTRDEISENQAVSACADSLAAILDRHPEPQPAPELATAMAELDKATRAMLEEGSSRMTVFATAIRHRNGLPS